MKIVQIGCNDGNDHCLAYVKNNLPQITEIHLVDPLPGCIEKAQKAYEGIKQAKFYQLMIGETNGEGTIYYPTKDPTSGHSSSILTHMHAHAHTQLGTLKLKQVTLNTFMEENKINNCDRLYIDTEGLDCKILLGFDYMKYRVGYIEFEILHTDGPFYRGPIYEKCVTGFRKNGYEIRGASEYNQCAIRTF